MNLKRRLVCPPGVSALDTLNDSSWQRHLVGKNRCFKCIVYKKAKNIMKIELYIQYGEK